MTTTTPGEPRPVLRTTAHAVPVIRSARERAALQILLLAATETEHTSFGSSRRDAFRTTRSLIAAARVLGFTLADLATMLGVSEGSVRNRSSVLTPILPSTFLSLVPTLQAVAAAAGLWDPESTRARPADPRELLAWYLSVSTDGAAR
ncbi:hypothetical protein [Curtobacterium flaccumfaciens]|jgi:hypothetical protein|uniref:hypothetical protein n=1 Tax=Curtobacterium flaccumfaciens TaxID=2035 RepID=UPI003B00E611